MTPQFTVQISDPRYEAHLVVDTLYQDRSGGGVRIAADLHLEEVCDLAREMSLKYALFRLPQGGAKMGVRLDPALPKEERLAVLEDLGRRLGAVLRGGIYYPGMDINCGPEELARLYRGAGIRIGTPTDTSYFTAISTASAVRGVLETLDGSGPWTLAVDGFGRVARHLAGLLPSECRIVALSTIEGAVSAPDGWTGASLMAARDAHGDAFVRTIPGSPLETGAVLTAAVDVLLPAARTRVLGPANLDRVRARAVVPIANAAYDAGGAEALHRRGVTVLPGYLVNGGGVLGSSLRDQGVPAAEILGLFDRHHRSLVADLIRAARESGTSPVALTEALAGLELARRRGARRPSSVKDAVLRRLSRRLPSRFRADGARARFVRGFEGIREDLARRERA